MTTYYELKKITIKPSKPGEFRIVTAAVLECSLCGGMIDGWGGPGHGAICVGCVKKIKTGQYRIAKC